MNKVSICLSEVDLNDYLTGVVSEEKKTEVENHLKDCAVCIEKFVFAYQTVEEFNRTKLKGVKFMLLKQKMNLWLLGAIITFVLSFFVPRYFIQLLVATILMAAKWIFDSVNARILIMIYDAWKKGDEKGTSNIIKTLNDRIKR